MLNLIIFEGYTFRRAAGDFKVSLNATSLGNSKSFASAARRNFLRKFKTFSSAAPRKP